VSNQQTPAGETSETLQLNVKVMVIDDSKTIRRSAETLLKKAGCEVVTATDGFEALAKITEHNPDIIFVDIMMPRLDGYQTCAGDHAVEQGQHLRPRPGPYRRFRGIPDQTLLARGSDRCDHVPRGSHQELIETPCHTS